MSKKSNVTARLVFVWVVAAGIVACRATPSGVSVVDSRTSLETESSEAESCKGAWGEASVDSYRVRFEMESVATDAVSPLPDAEGRVVLDGVLVLTDTGRLGCRNQRHVRFRSVDTIDWRVLGASVETGRSLFLEYTAQASYNADGRLTEIRFDEKAPRAWAAVMAQLLVVAQPFRLNERLSHQVTPGPDQWGIDPLEWTRGSCDERGCEWVGRVAGTGDTAGGPNSPSVDGTTRRGVFDTRIRRNDAGVVALDVQRRIEFLRGAQVVSTMVVSSSWEKLEAEKLGPEPLIDNQDGVMVAWSQLDDAAQRSALEKRVDGLTGDQVLDTLKQHGQGGTVPEHSRWLWRVVGLLRLKPDFAAALRAAVHPNGVVWGGMGPMLVLDVLANAGTDAAQRAAVDLLSDPSLRQRPDYGRLIQSLILVRYPRQWLVETTARLVNSLPAGAARRGAINTLGVLIGRWGQSGGIVPKAWLDHIETAVEPGAYDEDRRAVLMALGNTKDTRVLPKLLAAVVNETPALRLTAVRALSQMPSEVSEQVFRTLIQTARTDSVAGVAAEALLSLKAVKITLEECPDVTELVARAKLDEVVALALVEWVAGGPLVVSSGQRFGEDDCRRRIAQQLVDAGFVGRAGHKAADLVREMK
ncbi:MAG: HEAT repeat domain-containing protein [Myxococcales bacterium]|nr:HEAT repeat domain-containing protein [Myxococcales bacterium]